MHPRILHHSESMNSDRPLISCSANKFLIGRKVNKPLLWLYYCNILMIVNENVIGQAEYNISSCCHMHFLLGKLLDSPKMKAQALGEHFYKVTFS